MYRSLNILFDINLSVDPTQKNQKKNIFPNVTVLFSCEESITNQRDDLFALQQRHSQLFFPEKLVPLPEKVSNNKRTKLYT